MIMDTILDTSSKEHFENEKRVVEKFLTKKIASFEKSLKNAEHSLEKSEAFEESRHIAELVKANYNLLQRGTKNLALADWKNENELVHIELDPKLSPKEVLEDLYKKSRKLQRAIEPLQALIKKLSGQYIDTKNALLSLPAIDTMQALEELKKKHKIQTPQEKAAQKPKTALPYHLFYSQTGAEILVGKSSESNHILTFQIARATDLWLHAHNVSGAHVVIRKKKDDVDPATLHDALQLALFHSKAKNQLSGRQEVTVTEQKYVSRTPSMPKGKVLVSKHKIMTCYLDAEKVKKIKQQLPH